MSPHVPGPVGFSILFEIGVALGTQPAPVVMAKATFQRVVTGSMQFAAVVLEKSAAISGKLICWRGIAHIHGTPGRALQR